MKKLLWVAALALVAGCGDDEKPASTTHVMSADLDLEIRDRATVTIEAEGATTNVSIVVSKGFGIVPEGTPLTGPGTIEDFPETDGVLYTAKLQGAAVAGGLCGDRPVSIGFSLHRDEGNERVSGGMAVYCGAASWQGTPVKVFRLAGRMTP